MTHLDYSTSLNCSCKCCKSFGPTLFLISNMHFATLNPETRRTRTLRILQADYLAASLKSALSKIDLLFLCAATSFARLKLLGGTARALNPQTLPSETESGSAERERERPHQTLRFHGNIILLGGGDTIWRYALG